jgi:DNA/RNA endonuclease YhcR with UshA esterase domain
MRRNVKHATIGLALLCATAPLAAHHSWTAEYDAKKPVTIKGTITKVEWTNPHTHFYLESKEEGGTVTTWNFEMASTLALERAGFSRKTLQVGEQVTIAGFGGKVVTTKAVASSITTPDGKPLFVSGPGGPGQ